MPLIGAKSVKAPSRGRAYHQFTGGYDYNLLSVLAFAETNIYYIYFYQGGMKHE